MIMRRSLFLSALLLTSAVTSQAAKERFIIEGFDPAVSPDGQQLAFARQDTGNIDLWLCNIDGSHARKLTDHEAADTSPDWSPDGTKIVFSSRRSGKGDLYVLTVDGSAPLERLTESDATEDDPSWSPDGRLIAFSLVDGSKATIGMVPPSGGFVRELNPRGHGAESDPSWTFDGEKLIIVTNFEGDSDLAGIRPDEEQISSGRLRSALLTDTADDELSPEAHPDRLLVAFTKLVPWAHMSMRADVRGIPGGTRERFFSAVFIGNAGGLSRGARAVSKRGENALTPTWTPDGRSIVYTRSSSLRQKSAGPEIWMISDVQRGKRKKRNKRSKN